MVQYAIARWQCLLLGLCSQYHTALAQLMVYLTVTVYFTRLIWENFVDKFILR